MTHESTITRDLGDHPEIQVPIPLKPVRFARTRRVDAGATNGQRHHLGYM